MAVLQTGEYKYDCKKWNKKNTTDKTWSNFNKLFADAYQNLKKQQEITVKHAVLHTANAAVAISSALDNMEMAATSDCNIISALTTRNVQLVSMNEYLTNQLNNAMSTIKQL